MATYLVTQATGQQSQWTIKHLLAAGARVHAVVRNPQKIPPALESPGVTLFTGETQDSEAIYKAAQGCKGVFLNTFPIPGLEPLQAKAVVDACKKAGVETIVASTTFLTGDRELWDNPETELRDYYISKATVEDIVRGAGFKAYTIVRPSFLHIDYMTPASYHNFARLASHGELDHAYNDGVGMPQTDAHDVGKYVAAALQDPAKFGGKEIGLGNECLTIDEVRDILARVSGRDVRARRKTPAEIEETKATIPGQRFHLLANATDFGPSLAAAKKVRDDLGITLNSLQTALLRDKDQLLKSLPT